MDGFVNNGWVLSIALGADIDEAIYAFQETVALVK